MEKRNEEKKESGKKERFDQEKESRLLMMCHRFIRVEDQFWELMREKLIHMKDLYAGRHAIHLCSVCLTIFVSGNPKKHRDITIGSLFFQFDPSKKTAKDVAEIFKEQGRVKRLKSGELLVGIPSFNQICVENHRSLEGSIIPFREGLNDQKTKENEPKTVGISWLKKRTPQRQTGRRKEEKSLKDKQISILWRPASKGSIPPLATSKSVRLNISSFKQNKATKKEE